MDGHASRKPKKIQIAAFLIVKSIVASLRCNNRLAPPKSMREYATKIFGKRGQDQYRPIKVVNRSMVLPSAVSLVGCLIGILSIGFVTSHFSVPLLLAPFGASVVLLFSVYDSPLAQPRNTLFGHNVSALIAGIIAVMHASYFGSDVGFLEGEEYVWIAVSVSVSVFAMQMLGLTHPPAGATAFIASTAVSNTDSLVAFMIPVTVGSLILIAVAIIFNNAIPKRRYPVYW